MVLEHSGLHLAAVGFTAMGVCAQVEWRRWRGCSSTALLLVAEVFALGAMVDTVAFESARAVLWAPLLIAAAIVVAAVRSPRRATAGLSVQRGGTGTHDALGLVAMAALLPLMSPGTTPTAGHAAHGGTVGLLVALVLAVAGGHVIATAVACVREARGWRRARHVFMACATALMAAAVVL